MPSRRGLHGILTTCIMLCLLLNTGSAQEARSGVVKPDSLFYVKKEIVITAVRAEENSMEVPLAITVVPQIVLQTQRGYGLDGILTLVPGVVSQSRSGGIDSRIQIRGFGARGAGQRSNAGTSRGIRFYTDGIPETEPDGRTSFDLVNTVHASSVEVVRSNASVLWGNASGGIVSVSTIPQTRTAFANIDFSTGSFGLLRQSLLANTPLGDGQAYVSITNTTLDGWRQNSGGSQTLGTIGIVTKPGDLTTLNLFVTGAGNEWQIPGPLTLGQFETDPQQAQGDTNIYKPTFVQRNERRDNSLIRIGSTLDHTFDAENGVSAMAFVQTKKLQRSERNTFRDFNRYHIGGNAVYRNIQLVGDNIHNRLLIGGDAQYQDGSILFYNLDPATQERGTTLRQNKREGALNAGVFIQDEVSIGELGITAGLRYDAVKYINEDYINPSADSTAYYTMLVPKLGLLYRVTPLMSVYANLGGGIEVPAGNETDPPAVIGSTTPTKSINPLLKPIISTTYEVGIKGLAIESGGFLRSLQYDVAAFYIGIQNDIVPYNSGAFYTTAGRSTRMGIEFGGMATTDLGFTLASSIAIMKTEYIDYVVDSGYINASLQGRTTSYSGNQQSGIPSLSATFRLRYDLPSVRGLFFEIESRTLGSYFADDANQITVEGWTVFSAAIGARLELISQHLALNILARADNFTNKSFMASAWINPDITNGGTPYIEPGIPSNYVITLGLNYTP